MAKFDMFEIDGLLESYDKTVVLVKVLAGINNTLSEISESLKEMAKPAQRENNAVKIANSVRAQLSSSDFQATKLSALGYPKEDS